VARRYGIAARILFRWKLELAGGAAWWLEPLQARLAEHVFASQILFADDTPIPLLYPGRGRTKPAGYGSTPETTGRGAAPIRRRRSISTARIAVLNVRRLICSTSREQYRLMGIRSSIS
jgi:hypothetical protein